MAIEFINKSEFARREGCNEKQVRRAIEKGILVANTDGLLDASLINSGWRKTNRRTMLKVSTPELSVTSDTSDKSESVRGVRESFARTDEEVDESAEAAAERLIATGGVKLVDYAEALRLKENYVGLLRKLEFEQKAGNLIELELAQAVFFEVFRDQRNAWLNWPVKFGPEIAADLGIDADKIVPILTTYLHKQIEQLGEPDPQFSQG